MAGGVRTGGAIPFRSKQYRALQDNEVRLLYLRKCQSEDELIRCGLYICQINNAPPYEALSYATGDVSSKEIIYVDDLPCQITKQLFNALKSIRRRQKDRILWVDAICINQEHISELVHQFMPSKDIFANATQVVVYLGEATLAMDLAMDFLGYIEKYGITRALLSTTGNTYVEGFREILNKRWFRRAWVLREIFSARTATLCLGSRAVSSNAFIIASEVLESKADYHILQVLKLMPGPRRDEIATSGFALHELLQRFRYAEAYDSRDKVYALLGMVDSKYLTAPILPDYNASAQDLIRKVIANLCYCELSCVPMTPYDTIDEFLSDLDLIDHRIVKAIFEHSKEIDLESLLQQGAHYITIDYSLLEAARRNRTKGEEMVKILSKVIDQERSTSPTLSEVSSVFSDISTPSTNASYMTDGVEVSILHVVEILLDDIDFAKLCQNGFNHLNMEPDKFANKLRRMLKIFGKSLSSEGQFNGTQLTAQLIVNGSRRMAALIRVRCDQNYEQAESNLISSKLTAMTKNERRIKIEELLQKTDSFNEEDVHQHVESNNDNSESDDELESTLDEKSTKLVPLEEIENLILSSQAFKALLHSLESNLKRSPKVQKEAGLHSALTQTVAPFDMKPLLQPNSNELLANSPQNPKRKSSTCTPQAELPKPSLWTWVYDICSNLFTTMETPKEGLCRIKYNCSCGEIMYVDVKELAPGGIDKFKEEIQVSLKAPNRQVLAGSNVGASGVLVSPQRVHFGGESSGGGSPISSFPGQNGRGEQSHDIQIGLGRQKGFQNNRVVAEARYLLLCVSTRNLAKLIHVDLRHVQNDQLLFDSIRHRYWDSRKNDSWHYGLLPPQWLVDRLPSAWKNWLETLHLKVPRTAELIKFRLLPFHTNICPDMIKLGLPPEEQVKVAKNYHYDPCPTTDWAVLSIPKFSHLLKPGVHSYDFWLKTFPKKLRTELACQPATIGWGLIIHEGWDWVVLLSGMLIIMVLIGIAVVLYAIFTHDASSGVGLGSYAVTILTLLAMLKYWAWQDQESS